MSGAAAECLRGGGGGGVSVEACALCVCGWAGGWVGGWVGGWDDCHCPHTSLGHCAPQTGSARTPVQRYGGGGGCTHWEGEGAMQTRGEMGLLDAHHMHGVIAGVCMVDCALRLSQICLLFLLRTLSRLCLSQAR